MEQTELAKRQLKAVNRTCHRIGCTDTATTGIRDRQSNEVLLFCKYCYVNLVDSGIIDPYARKFTIPT